MQQHRERMAMWSLLGLATILVITGLAPRWLPQVTPDPPTTPNIRASIQGAVRTPGTYALAWGARLEDLIASAGGATSDAALELLNLAAPIAEASHWTVPRTQAPTGEERISINGATTARLERLPGVGPVVAERIMAARPFHSIEDLIRVRGIGPATMERLRPFVRP